MNFTYDASPYTYTYQPPSKPVELLQRMADIEARLTRLEEEEPK